MIQDHSDQSSSKKVMNPLMVMDSSVPLMHHEWSNLESLITSKEHTVITCSLWVCVQARIFVVCYLISTL